MYSAGDRPELDSTLANITSIRQIKKFSHKKEANSRKCMQSFFIDIDLLWRGRRHGDPKDEAKVERVAL